MKVEMDQMGILKPLSALGLAIALGASACVSDDSQTSRETDTDTGTDLVSEDISLTSGLQTVSSCEALLDQLKHEGLERVGPYGFDSNNFIDVNGRVDDESGEMAISEMGSDQEMGSVEQDFTTTNVQEQNVDEADIVKTDGKRLVSVANGIWSVLDTSGPEPKLLSKKPLPEGTELADLFLIDDTAFVISQWWKEARFDAEGAQGPTETTQILEIDVAEGTIRRTLEFEGTYMSAREVDGILRFVLWSATQKLPFLFPSSSGAEDTATETNRQIIRESTIDQWLPTYRVYDGGSGTGTETASGLAVPCDRFYFPGEFSGFGTALVLTVDSADGASLVDSLGVMTSGQSIYASTDRLAIATARGPDFDENGQPAEGSDFRTQIHSFDITNPSSSEYVGSGSVPGHMLSQYSMSEYQGDIRVATTSGSPWWGDDGTSESFVTILAERGNKLETIGQVGGIGKNETIFAARFLGDTAFLVTYRRTDPFYVIDLTDHTNPTIAGELKIPGFSSYLHPIGDDLIIGVGQDGTDDGMTTGSQIAIFDVTKPTTPLRIHQLSIGPAESNSPVEWDPHAFTWLAEDRLAFVPVSAWSYDEATGSEHNTAAVVVVKVAEDGSLEEVGRVGHKETSECETYEDDLPPSTVEEDGETLPVEPDRWCYSYQPDIRRSVVIRDTLYTVSDDGIMASEMEGLGEIAWFDLSRR